MRIDPSGPVPDSVRWVHGVLGALNLVLGGMVVYLRLGPFRTLVSRLAEREVALPGWLIWGFTAGTLLIAGFLAWRGVRLVRKALRPEP